MEDIIREGGWPMYPVMAFGFTALGLSIKHALTPQRSLMPLIIGVAIACLLTGVFGTTVGLQHSIHYIMKLPPDQRWIVAVGLREALNCFATALLLTLPTVLFTMAGAHRITRDPSRPQ